MTHPDSKYNNFNCGNIDTLNKDDIVERLKEFFEKNYSANLMTLTIVSNKEFGDMESKICDLFSPIKNLDVKNEYS